MNKLSPAAAVYVSVPGETAFLKINGRANFTSSVNFKTVINELLARGVKEFVFDLSGCVTMDSTFLGVLAGFALGLNDGKPATDGRALKLVNPNARVADLVENLGVADLFTTVTGVEPIDGCIDPSGCADKPSREEVTQTCLEAHKVLMSANPENVSKFKDVVRFLAEDLNHK